MDGLERKPEPSWVPVRLELRRARPADIRRMLALMEPHVASEDLLPRTPLDLLNRLDEFLLLEAPRRELVALGALYRYGSGLAEIRSLAVAAGREERGFGRLIVASLLDKARADGLARVIALTRKPEFFERLGFARTRLELLPEKVTQDCRLCPRRERCDETAVIVEL